MKKDPNPYAPPNASGAAGGVWDAARQQAWEHSLRSTSNFAMGLGAMLGLLALAMPTIMEWQWLQVLRPYGAEGKIGLVIDAHIAPLQAGFIAQLVLSALTLVAGILLRRGELRALPVLRLLFLVLLVHSVWCMFSWPRTPALAAATGLAWLLFALRRSAITCRMAAEREQFRPSVP